MDVKELDQTWRRFLDNVLFDWINISMALLFSRVISIYGNPELCIPIWSPSDEKMLNEEGLDFVIEKMKKYASDYPGLDQLSFTYIHPDGSLVRADIKHPDIPAFIE